MSPTVIVPPHRLTDAQALGVLGAYIAFRAVTQRVGLAVLPALLKHAVWAIPLMNNSMLTMITAGTVTRSHSSLLAVTALASVAQSVVAGLVLYWAGKRFGVHLAERAEGSGSMWKTIWNPQQVLRAHRWLDRWGMVTVALVRGFFEWMIVPIVLVAGSSRMHRARFLSSYIFGSAVFAGLTLWVGGRAAQQWPWLPHRIESFAGWSLRIGLVLLILLVVVALVSWRKQPQPSSTTTPSQGASESEPPTA